MERARYALVGIGLAACLAMGHGARAFDSGDNSGYKAPAAMGDSAELTKARAAIAAKDYPGAIQVLYAASKRAPHDADVMNLLGYSYRMLGQYPQAFIYYDQALAIMPLHKGALEYEGEAYLETRQLPKAENNFAALKRACPTGCDELADLQAAVARYKRKQALVN